MGKQIVKRESLTEQIRKILIDRIIDGDLAAGDRLKELTIANEFGTSQAPVREAIRSLQAMGYVEHKPHVGALVRTYSKQEIEEAYQIREALEGHCLILADKDIERLIQRLNLHLDDMHRAVQGGNIHAFSEADNRFHRAIVEFSGNQSMMTVWESLRIQHQVIATVVEAAMPLENLYNLHPPIIATLDRNHREGAARYLAAHYRKIALYWRNEG